ncbi:NADH:flavin oxidoreductase [Halomarina litorea]|uniref:oxidoreductase n=1 Tax=Halomarina litorea TaxID=2961595 RepID=UPI0020C46FC1|nr:NADH:flavin oxidoreductase [Halomarina sp. BCD28]
MSIALDTPLDVGGLRVPNRLYRAPLLECAGDGPDAADALVDELVPTVAAGCGLVFQGAAVVRPEGGCVAPNMTRLHDRESAMRLRPLTEAVHDHGGRIVVQLDHGGLRSLETWHHGYRREHPELRQLAVSRPPRTLRALSAAGVLSLDAHVLSTDEVYDLAADFGRAAHHAVAAGYDGVHLAGANMGLIQQFCSPYYNRRDDEFADGARFLEVVHDEVRKRAGDVPLLTKVPAETHRPPFVRTYLSRADGVRLAERLAEYGYDAVVPVESSTFWDASIVRGRFPDRAWEAPAFQSGYAAAFGGPRRARLVEFLTRVATRRTPFEAAWNAEFCREVRGRVDVPVLCEGGVRGREEMDRLLGEACDMVGVGRPFYAEPRLAARLLADPDARAACRNCNNCVVPQAAGAEGVCRTPSVLRERAARKERGEYDAPGDR